MQPSTPAWTNFTAGELSPRLEGRFDFGSYFNGAREITNFTVHPHGGASRRPGSRYVAEVKDSAKKVRLEPFVFSDTEAYVLEFGDQYLRFFADEGQVVSGATPYEIATPYYSTGATDHITALKMTQSADTVYICHPNIRPYKLTRGGHTDWSLATFAFSGGTAALDVGQAWTGATWPGAVTFYEQRAVYAATPDRPQTHWFSKTGDFEDFTVGDEDDDAMIYTIASDYLNPIRWLCPKEALHVGTLGSLWAAGTRTDLDPISPGNIRFARTATYGTADIQGRVVGGSLVWVGRNGKRFFEQSYSVSGSDLSQSGLVVKDLMLLSNHIAAAGIVDFDWAQDPDHTLWAVLSDGDMVTGTYYPPESVMAWCRQETQGEYESLAVIPHGGRDQVWTAVRREINGQEKRYIEFFEGEFTNLDDAFFVDCGLSYTGATPLVTVSGLDHLALATVDILAGGAVHPQKQVSSGGALTLDWQNGATPIHVGLPYTSTITTMRLDPKGPQGTGQAKQKRIHQAAVRFYQTVGAKVGVEGEHMEVVNFRTTSDPMDAAVPLFTGDKTVKLRGGYNPDGRVTVTQNQPLPATVLGIYPRLATYE